MLYAIRHRGPEVAGVYLDGPVGLGHDRLSIIDLAGGLQPIANEDGSHLDHLQWRDVQLHRAARGADRPAATASAPARTAK